MIDPTSIESIPNNNISNKMSNPANNAAFSAELESAIDKNTPLTNSKSKTPLSKKNSVSSDFLGQLKQFNSVNTNFNSLEIQTLSKTTNISEKDIASVLEELKQNLMKDIKNSVLNLEKQINDPENKVPDDLKDKFLGAIDNIKNDFTVGFGEDFNTFDTSVNNNSDTDQLIDKLLSFKNQLPSTLISKLDRACPKK